MIIPNFNKQELSTEMLAAILQKGFRSNCIDPKVTSLVSRYFHQCTQLAMSSILIELKLSPPKGLIPLKKIFASVIVGDEIFGEHNYIFAHQNNALLALNKHIVSFNIDPETVLPKEIFCLSIPLLKKVQEIFLEMVQEDSLKKIWNRVIDKIPVNIYNPRAVYAHIARLYNDPFHLPVPKIKNIPLRIASAEMINEFLYEENSFIQLSTRKIHRYSNCITTYPDLYTIPPAIECFQNLISLKCPSTNLMLICDEIKNLKNLKILDLSFNKIKKIKKICFLLNLTELNISHNRIKIIPETISNLQKLELMYAGHNKITNIPETLNSLKNLKILSLKANNIIKISSYLQLESITEIDLSHNKIRKQPEKLSKLMNLECINLSFNQIKIIDKSIFTTNYLKKINFQNNQIELLNVEKKLYNIKDIQLSNNYIAEFPKWVSYSKLTKRIWISNNRIKFIPDQIENLTYLKVLILDENKIEQIPESMGELKNLNYLSVSHNFLKELPNFFSKLSKLRALNIRNNHIKELPISILFCKELYSLNIKNNPIEIIPDSYFQSNKIHIQKTTEIFKSNLCSILHSPLGLLYQSLLEKKQVVVDQIDFPFLTLEENNFIKENWASDDVDQLCNILKSIILEKFNNLTTENKNKIYIQLESIIEKKREGAWGQENAFNFFGLLAEALYREDIRAS